MFRRFIYKLGILIMMLLISGCNNSNSASTEEKLEDSEPMIVDSHRGKTLMETNCYICHNPSLLEHNGRIGPPMIAIKARYLMDEPTKEEFIAGLWNFLDKPDLEKAKMKGAIEKFGLMPYQPFKKEDIEMIGEYLYEFEIEEPVWFKAHWREIHPNRAYRNQGKKVVSSKALSAGEIGLTYATETKKALGMKLMGTIQKQGLKEALSFCNAQALQLTDSMAASFGATIRRISDKPRNQLNKANEAELKHIGYYKSAITNKHTLEPIVEETNEDVHFYYPIVTNDLCLKCHGSIENDIQPDLLSEIKSHYPEDMAVEYGVNEVRGIWSISFQKDEKKKPE
ncbi:MAG: DUF3365 domain-containing protein [Bacteroidia bacterium]|nr:DUF3365 domain-containing protein [Bacteroidia bacterium]